MKQTNKQNFRREHSEKEVLVKVGHLLSKVLKLVNHIVNICHTKHIF
jgi:hypothetical protein